MFRITSTLTGPPFEDATTGLPSASYQPPDTRVVFHGNCWAKHWIENDEEPTLPLPIGMAKMSTAKYSIKKEKSYMTAA